MKFQEKQIYRFEQHISMQPMNKRFQIGSRLVQSFSPLWLFLSIALVLRVWLVMHTHGVIDGDEALVGIQAQHILQGERPLYFYGQAYMGSLEAYLVSILFVLFGSSVWVLRAEPILLSLILIWLTWRCSHMLAKRASLSLQTTVVFTWSSTLSAAILPLYDTIAELHILGGYIEIFVLMLLLMLSVSRLIDRWQAEASRKELALRWCGVGFLIGLGFWIDPLVICAVVAVAIWIAWGSVGMWRLGRLGFYDSIPAFAVIPSALIGALPALYWGAQNHWANVTYVFQQGSSQPLRERLKTIWGVAKLYRTCIGPEVLGGRTPLESDLSNSIHVILYYGSVFCVGMVAVLIIASFIRRSSSLIQIRRIATLPLLFVVCTVVIFCASSAATNGLGMSCNTDFVGRYASPILVTLPFLVATMITTFFVLFRHSHLVHSIVLILYLVTLVAQIFTYTQVNPGLTFQSPYCLDAPANDDLVITYMEREHINYAWATNFVGNPITFKTSSKIIAIDPTGITSHQDWLNRLPTYTEAVEHADRPSILQLVASNDVHPQFLRELDQMHITYRVARFHSEPDVDLMVVTPLNRNVPITTAPVFYGMFVCQM